MLVLGKKSDEPCNADERGISIEGGRDGETEGERGTVEDSAEGAEWEEGKKGMN